MSDQLLPVRIGVDVGGTFTDLVLLDERTGHIAYHKTPSTPGDPSTAIAVGVEELLHREGVAASRVAYVGHGTTVATNMVIERRGAKTAVVTTRGFRDVLEIARQTRPHLYDYTQSRPPPLASRALRFEINERLDALGDVLVPICESEVDALIEDLKTIGDVGAVAVCFLHSYRNPVHEQHLVQRIADALPHLYVCRSSDVLAEFREFERTSTTVMNAYVGPRMRHYMEQLTARLADIGVQVAPLTMQSNGGLMSADAVRAYPVRTCLSGPAAGVVAAGALSVAAGVPGLIAFDVGGTSTDVSLVIDGKPATTAEREVAGYPVRSAMVDVHVIGAGGGSIARVDEAGGLKVGPRSAGADPGPVAYGRGGEWVTLTDANVVLGRLNPQSLLGGRMQVDAEVARAALREQIAQPLGISLEAAALGIIEVAVANIARAIRSVSTARGYDPATMALLAYGGAGPVHAVSVAREVQGSRVIVPVEPGTLCARGILLSNLNTDFVRTVMSAATAAGWQQLQGFLKVLCTEADAWLNHEQIAPPERGFELSVDARYDGQSFEVPVSVASVGVAIDEFRRSFHAAHRGVYGYDLPEREIILVNARVRAIGQVPKAELLALDGVEREAKPMARDVFIDRQSGWQEIPVYGRGDLSVGLKLHGPAVIEEMSSTVFLGQSDTLEVDAYGNLNILLGDLDEDGL
ncbi:MAG: hydantoinase/oxoprolinase family protein [Chromatiales bacterium]|nr:hydantoinase/oxoprolinase family protein [Chromatiales bacterium]